MKLQIARLQPCISVAANAKKLVQVTVSVNSILYILKLGKNWVDFGSLLQHTVYIQYVTLSVKTRLMSYNLTFYLEIQSIKV